MYKWKREKVRKDVWSRIIHFITYNPTWNKKKAANDEINNTVKKFVIFIKRRKCKLFSWVYFLKKYIKNKERQKMTTQLQKREYYKLSNFQSNSLSFPNVASALAHKNKTI